MTCCDTVSGFAGRGKKTAWDVWMSYHEATAALLQLAASPDDIPDDYLALLEQLIGLLYDRTSGLDKRQCPAPPGTECPVPPKRKCPTLPVRARHAVANERLHSDVSERVPPTTRKRLAYATSEYHVPSEPQRESPALPKPQRGSPASPEPQRESPALPEPQRGSPASPEPQRESPALPEPQRENPTSPERALHRQSPREGTQCRQSPREREPSIVALDRVPHAVAAAPSPCQAGFRGCC
ncbi:UNVERIFIED_CONTAM: hypothetical protein FKN15_056548 [Acipenser sinensis]